MWRNIVFIIDTSYSMSRKFNDFVPNKIRAVKEVLAYALTRLFDKYKDVRVGAVVFFSKAYPILSLTISREGVLMSIRELEILGEGSAPGDGLIEAVKMMRRKNGLKETIMITDGGFNEGIPLNIAAIYAANSGVKTSFIAIKDYVNTTDLDQMFYSTKICNGEVLIVENKSETIMGLMKLFRNIFSGNQK
ncbi:vWA domain-containing protein [Staphylothermus hellenicus]|uniref:von Willebrand factor type A n=1 Tax=Staphylothermus hellenicus (strain DSM 12710 / JCM 10830 / BK20S6-10-b1 / P8) TaxID=591019 RepID=D7D994_STAHD|nr:VWA domain-containing protein [Staphylothermus hellenicus]ADI32340.1 von Willebrand factor type A [Staphylothermus hellenicus DSM 12710]